MIPLAVRAASSSWAWLSSPYTLSALAAGALAIALSYFLSVSPTPQDAKRRVVAGDVRRVGVAAFVFKGSMPNLPDILLDASSRKLIALHPRRRETQQDANEGEQQQQEQSTSSRSVSSGGAPRLSIALPLRSGLFSREDFREEPLADIAQLRVLEQGLHFHDGRAVAISVDDSPQENLLQFKSRVATEAFLDVLNRAKTPSESRPKNLSMFLTTFNVGNAQPPDDLSPWLARAVGVDVIAIGAQECSYTAVTNTGPQVNDRASVSAEAVTEATPLLEREDTENDSLKRMPTPTRIAQGGTVSGKEHWHALIASHFPDDEYECIAKLTAWDRCLSIFVKMDLLPSVSRVRHDTANVGLGGVAGNKGAIGARFSVFDTDFVIINSHLAAHHKEVNRRNEDFASIASGMRGLRDNPEVDWLASPVHHVFWMGDLNYRINLERDRVLELVQSRDWEQLHEADQLQQEMEAGRSFQGFLEGRIDFAPTYRYEIGSRVYSAVKLRIPSYCDRILYRSLPGCSLELLEYQPCDEIVTSDHSPVYALFSASLSHTTGWRDFEAIGADTGVQEARDLGLISPIVSPRSLSALLPSGLPGFSAGTGAQLMFKSLSAVDIPDMDHGGRRIAVAKALHIHNHVGWKKHEELGAGRHADPYCTFHGTAVAELDEGIYRTRTITASQNPVWEAEGIAGIDLISSEYSVLSGRYVVITVKDEIPTRRDEPIGSAVLWLGEGGSASECTSDNPREFNLPIMLGGRRQGEIRGSYFIKKT